MDSTRDVLFSRVPVRSARANVHKTNATQKAVVVNITRLSRTVATATATTTKTRDDDSGNTLPFL
jgi:hypothetical protein